MTEEDNPSAAASRSGKKKSETRAAAKKAEARAAALRANLMKRKQQTKTRADTGAKQNAASQTDTQNEKED